MHQFRWLPDKFLTTEAQEAFEKMDLDHKRLYV